MTGTRPLRADASGVAYRPDRAEATEPPSPAPEWEFPGCKTIGLSCDEAATYEGRFEFWDAHLETAWVVSEPTSPDHEHPSQRLATMAERIASVRGSPIQCFGAMDLLLRDARGEPWRILQADQSVYLDPRRAELLGTSAMVVGENRFPDVVLEVDHTTDVRPSKLGLYESWGFPEVWVEVPERRAPSRPRGRAPGLTIHLREGGAYRVAAESRAFPGWTAGEIHAAMNEVTPSARTYAALERVGAVLGAREGTGPDDDPLLRSQRRQGREEGRAKGRAEGIEQGRAEERTLLCRLAARKFDAETAERLSGRLDGLTAPGMLAEVGEWIIECDTGAELLERTGRMIRRA